MSTTQTAALSSASVSALGDEALMRLSAQTAKTLRKRSTPDRETWDLGWNVLDILGFRLNYEDDRQNPLHAAYQELYWAHQRLFSTCPLCGYLKNDPFGEHTDACSGYLVLA